MTDTPKKDSSGADLTDQAGQNRLPAQKAMKQFSKTDAERDQSVGPNDGPALTQRVHHGKPPGTA